MKKIFKNWLCVVLAAMLLVATLPVSVGAVAPTAGGSAQVASSNGQAPLKVVLSSDKNRYSLLNKIEFTAIITNTSNSTVSNISAEASFSRYIRGLKKNSETTATKNSLAPGESFQMRFYAQPYPTHISGIDVFVLPLIWVSSLFRGGLLPQTGNSAFDYDRAYTKAEINFDMSGLSDFVYEASVTVGVWYGGTKQSKEIPTAYYKSDQSHMVFDSPNLGYIDNIVIVGFKKDATNEDKIRVANSINGTIVGHAVGAAQIKIKPTNKDGLEEICKIAMQDDSVFNAWCNMVIPAGHLDGNAIPNDPWRDTFNGIFGTDWDEDNPSGLNWWLEAIHAPSAWDYDRFSEITIGIADDGFDTSHEDLNITVLNSDVNDAVHHGTYIAGVIGATANNGIGITGIVWKANLLGVDIKKTKEGEKNNIEIGEIFDAFGSLLDNGARIINFSQGKPGSDLSQEGIREQSDQMTDWIVWVLDNKPFAINDFLLVQGAGNDTHDARQSGFFASMTHQSVSAHLQTKGITSHTANEILDHVIVVGSIDKPKNGYKLTDFSNYGETVDIVAPGSDIFTTSVMGGFDGNYVHMVFDGKASFGIGPLKGTSLSAPMVTGVAALVWSVKLSFTASEVKAMVCNNTGVTAKGYHPADTKTYNVLNAKSSVDKAIALQKAMPGEYSSIVKDGDTIVNGSNSPLADVHVKAVDTMGNTISVTTDSTGKVYFLLPEGQYTIEYSKEGYQTASFSETIVRGEHIKYDSVWLSKLGGITLGRVLDQGTNKPLPGVLVEAYKTGTTAVVSSSTTDASGYYYLSTIQVDVYDLKFSKAGYVEQIREKVSSISLPDVVMVPSGGGGTPSTGDDGTTNWDFINPVTHQKTAPSGYTGISTPQQLNDVRNNLSGKYILMGDIDLASWGNWVPIGDESNAFSGELDGNGYVIKNMTINITTSNSVIAGLFGVCRSYPATVKNLQISGSITINMTSSSTSHIYVGGIIAMTHNEGGDITIENCINKCTITAQASGTSGTYEIVAGGIIGHAYPATMRNCSNKANVTVKVTEGGRIRATAGGIAGNLWTNGRAENCRNEGAISTYSKTSYTNYYTIAKAGGIAGDIISGVIIKNGINVGDITANAEAVYPTLSTSSSHAGGIYAGMASGGYYDINNCSNNGQVVALGNANVTKFVVN